MKPNKVNLYKSFVLKKYPKAKLTITSDGLYKIYNGINGCIVTGKQIGRAHV